MQAPALSLNACYLEHVPGPFRAPEMAVVVEPTSVLTVWTKWDSVSDMLSPEFGTQRALRQHAEGQRKYKRLEGQWG